MAENTGSSRPSVDQPLAIERGGIMGWLNDSLALTTRPISSLRLVTAIGGLFLAAEGIPPLQTLTLVCIGGALGAGGANAINHFLDQDIDLSLIHI